MRIGELAKAAGVGEETIRFYEKRGLLPAPLRTMGNYRVYGAQHLEKLRFIKHCRSLDIRLDEIAKLLSMDSRNPDNCREAHRLIDLHLAAVKRKIADLEFVKAHLEALKAQCHGPDNGEPCGLIEGLKTEHCCEVLREEGIEDPEGPKGAFSLLSAAK